MKRLVSVFAMAALVAACADGTENSSATASSGEKRNNSASATSKAEANNLKLTDAKPRSIDVETDLMEFSYSYPALVASIPKLASLMDSRLDDTGSALEKDAQAAKAEAEKNNYPYRTYSTQVEWKVVRDLPDWLSLSANIYTYTGGAHGMHVFDSLVWDKKANIARNPLDLFISGPSLSKVTEKAFCDALDKEREKKRGEPVRRDPDALFSECIDPVENSTIILGSSDGQSFDRIGFLVPPYNAGPYVEGEYEVTLPVTAEIKTMVKPEFRSSFVLGK
ncbi:DUF3298/DUF4163 domain-containing protein [Altericroceibacterium spongiae]|uniref:DUF3298/DUF4163 domain-containing protein n=1 Tax=Altericroceibacterium spongiae TaxID=2320269 RepID=A0A420EMM7_9SPHN|nr:DUF4163 domain-containing protein [Altericroceibacterium spongiae]RKF21969.1 DUF3298/DUF4163 domain-containing protein [Altericroceibacterium spongiae]